MKIGLLGSGVVGLGVFRIIRQTPSDLSVKSILSLEDFEEIHPYKVSSIEEITKDPEIDTVVECMGGLHPAYEFVAAALNAGKNVVTTNKHLASVYYKEFQEASATHGASFVFSATTGGSIPWLYNLNRNGRFDEVSEIAGIMNGTSNFILTKMDKENLTFETALKMAQEAGFAEADPTADVDGFDTQRKLALSCDVAFNAFVKADDIPRFGMRQVKKEVMDYAKATGQTIKLVGVGKKNADDTVCAYVEPRLIPANNPFYPVENQYNFFYYIGKYSGKQGYYGEGAGRFPTAYNVVEDLWDLQENRAPKFSGWSEKAIDLQEESHAYVVYTTAKPDAFLEEIGEEKAPHLYVTKEVAVKKMHDWANTFKQQDEQLFFAGILN